MEANNRLRGRCNLIKRCFVGAVKTGANRVLVLMTLIVSTNGVGAQDRPLGVNLTDVSPFGTLWYYTNALKQSSGWLVYNTSDERDVINLSSELTAELRSQYFDGNGYPLQVPFEADAHPEMDSNPASGINYYRIKQVDFDGQFDFSPIIDVNTDFFSVQQFELYPNPTRDNLTVQFENFLQSPVSVASIDLFGKIVVQSKIDPSANLGKFRINLPENMYPGIYLLMLSQNGQVDCRTFVKQ